MESAYLIPVSIASSIDHRKIPGHNPGALSNAEGNPNRNLDKDIGTDHEETLRGKAPFSGTHQEKTLTYRLPSFLIESSRLL